MYRRPKLERTALGKGHADHCVEPSHRGVGSFVEQPVAATDCILTQVRAEDVEGAALSRPTRFGRVVLFVNAAHSHGFSQGRGDQVIHPIQAGPLNGETAVDGEPEVAAGPSLSYPPGGHFQMAAQRRQARDALSETRNRAAPAKPVADRRAVTVALVSATLSRRVRLILVMATAPSDTPSRSRMARCFLVCGIGPSSSATTRSA